MKLRYIVISFAIFYLLLLIFNNKPYSDRIEPQEAVRILSSFKRGFSVEQAHRTARKLGLKKSSSKKGNSSLWCKRQAVFSSCPHLPIRRPWEKEFGTRLSFFMRRAWRTAKEIYQWWFRLHRTWNGHICRVEFIHIGFLMRWYLAGTGLEIQILIRKARKPIVYARCHH